ncbi:hypothetical protein WISP_148761 [Willisornis vidua]|uniref:Uncharacterized protein n=1 Tax=Willisornis vidua TaxID=1566151 RepID=A0ABQ9CQF7_9PASS|nr:hypothetical protein WISP_148761 [Willisornis vidua]
MLVRQNLPVINPGWLAGPGPLFVLYVNQGCDPAARSTQLEGYNMYRNDSKSQDSKLAISEILRLEMDEAE